jgi:hypothetical protein
LIWDRRNYQERHKSTGNYLMAKIGKYKPRSIVKINEFLFEEYWLKAL